MLSDDDCAGETSKIRISSLTELSGCQGDSLCTVEDEYINYTCKDRKDFSLTRGYLKTCSHLQGLSVSMVLVLVLVL